MNNLLILAAGGQTENYAHLPPINELIWGGIAFFLVVGLLTWKGGPAIKKAWNGRIEGIQSELDQVEATRGKAEAELASVRTRIANVDSERERILDEARQSATALKAQLIERATTEAAEVRVRAAADIEASRAQAMADLSAEASALAIGAAEEIVKSNLDAETQRSLVEAYIAKVGSSS